MKMVIVPILEFGDNHHWTKGLFLGNEHVVLYISKHSGLHEKSWQNKSQ